MKTKFTLLWLAVMVAIAPLGNNVYASGSQPANGAETSLTSLPNPDGPNLGSNPPPVQSSANMPDNQGPVAGESLRIGTYNFQFWPSGYEDVLPKFPDLCCDNIDDRERKVAERILANGYDIIAFQEVWDGGAKEQLVHYLSEQYPYFVRYVADSGNYEDSGLMLFSKFPFEKLPQDTYKVSNQDDVEYFAQYEGQPWDDVAFTYYGSSCSGNDCYAGKGAGYVRIRNPQTERIYNVVFTHLDAQDTDKDSGLSEIRQAQLAKVEQLITGTMWPEQIATEEIFFLGDMNINGNHAAQNCRREWDSLFGDGNATQTNPDKIECQAPGQFNPFFHNVLHDAWEYETQPPDRNPRDTGMTGDINKGGEDENQDSIISGDELKRSRLDYILRNTQPSDRLCMQHMTLAYNLRYGEPYVEGGMGEAGIQDLSDHYGLNADLNLQAPHCSPSIAKVDLPFDQWWNDGWITYPGSMQWFYFESAGTYSISLSSDGPVDFQVYKSTDLSSPIEKRGVPTGRWTFNFPEGHFYIRVFARDRTSYDLPYKLMVHRNDGSNPGDAIVLFPNQPINQPFSENETKWFRIMTEAPDSGQAQKLMFFANDSVGTLNLELELRAADANTVIPSSSSPIVREDVADNNQVMFLLVKNNNQPGEYQIGWTTNLTVLHGTLAYPLKMRGDEQTDSGINEDDDDVKFSLYTEGDGDEHIRIDNVLLLANWDEGRVRGLGDIFQTARFTQELVVKLNEYDAFNNNDILRATIKPLPPSDPTQPLPEGQPRTVPFTVELLDQPGDSGKYLFYYNLSHGLEFGFPSDPLVVDAGPDRESPEGEIIILTETSFTDAGFAAGYTTTIDWGDGSPIEAGTVEVIDGGGNLHFDTHIYEDNGTYTVNICVTADGIRTACDTLNANVFNVAPTANIELSAATLVNGIPTFFGHAWQPVGFTGYSTDPGRDDLVLHWNWGDGSPISEIIDLFNSPGRDLIPNPIIQSLGVVNPQTHTFELVYVYTIKFWATDDDGGASPVDTAVVIVTGNTRQSRPTGYWQDQFGLQVQTNFDEPTLMRYLTINDYLSGIFDEVRDASTIESASDVLSIDQNQSDAKEQFDSELLTVWLNFANGAIEYHQLLNVDGRNAEFAEIVAYAEAIRRDPMATDVEIRRQRNILRSINR
jgi:hypothetical protein